MNAKFWKERILQTILLIVVSVTVIGAAVIAKIGGNDQRQQQSETVGGEAQEAAETPEHIQQAALEAAKKKQEIAEILSGGSKEFFAGKPVDCAFLLWLEDSHGPVLEKLSQKAALTYDTWQELTGKTLQVLWTEYDLAYGRESYLLEDLSWAECKEDTVTISFIGDINLDRSWYTMQKLSEKKNDFGKCISAPLRKVLKESDLTLANNEFTFGTGGRPLKGKAYTFQANPDAVFCLQELGIDFAGMANNHTWDYGRGNLVGTKDTLETNGIETIGAGTIDEARAIHYVIANGRKYAFVAATEVEKFSNYTKDATEDTEGVYKMTDPKAFLDTIAEAKRNSDHVFAFVHWGVEGQSYHSPDQTRLAKKMIKAGADAIIGSHTHRLQGVEYIDGVPVVYSLGNFWFSTGTLFTSAAQFQVTQDGEISLRMLPLIQKDVKTSLIRDKKTIDRFYRYLTDMSEEVAVTAEGECFDLKGGKKIRKAVLKDLKNRKKIVFQSEQEYTKHSSGFDSQGRRIDVVGNLE